MVSLHYVYGCELQAFLPVGPLFHLVNARGVNKMQSNQNSNNCPGLNAKNTKESFCSAIVDVSEAVQGPHELWATGVKKRQSCVITACTSLNASKADLQNFVHKALCLGEIQQALIPSLMSPNQTCNGSDKFKSHWSTCLLQWRPFP